MDAEESDLKVLLLLAVCIFAVLGAVALLINVLYVIVMTGIDLVIARGGLL